MSTVIDYTEQIQRGVDLLNKEQPGWVDEIDPEILDLNSVQTCVLGQLYDNFYRGLDELDLWSSDADDDYENCAQEHGFEGDLFNDLSYRQLTEQWMSKISELQAA